MDALNNTWESKFVIPGTTLDQLILYNSVNLKESV